MKSKAKPVMTATKKLRKHSKPPTRSAPARPTGSASWPLWKHMKDNHGLILLESEMDDICRIVLEMRIPKNWCDSLLTGPTRALTGEAGKWGCPDIENLLTAIRTGCTPNVQDQRRREQPQGTNAKEN